MTEIQHRKQHARLPKSGTSFPHLARLVSKPALQERVNPVQDIGPGARQPPGQRRVVRRHPQRPRRDRGAERLAGATAGFR